MQRWIEDSKISSAFKFNNSRKTVRRERKKEGKQSEKEREKREGDVGERVREQGESKVVYHKNNLIVISNSTNY